MRRTKSSYGGVIVRVSLAILVLGGLYWALRPDSPEYGGSGSHSSIYRLTISAPRSGEELPAFEATQGETVTLIISSDRAGEIDVHGYGQKIDLVPDGEVALVLAVTRTGVFGLFPCTCMSRSIHRHLPVP